MAQHRRVLAEALDLPVRERAKLVGRLLESLDAEDADPHWAQAWADEIAHRIGDLDAGTQAIPLEEALDQIARDDENETR